VAFVLGGLHYQKVLAMKVEKPKLIAGAGQEVFSASLNKGSNIT
jgi:hypothetical protein